MPAQDAVRVARPRGEIDPRVVDDILAAQRTAVRSQQQLERLVAKALAGGAPLNELSRQTGIAKTTLLRWSKR